MQREARGRYSYSVLNFSMFITAFVFTAFVLFLHIVDHRTYLILDVCFPYNVCYVSAEALIFVCFCFTILHSEKFLTLSIYKILISISRSSCQTKQIKLVQ